MHQQPQGADRPARPLIARRTIVTSIALAPLAALVPRVLDEAMAAAAPANGPWRFFTPHQGLVITAATARLVPGPSDDPTEAGHPGAREANVTRYIDTMLAVFTYPVPPIHAGGPWSDRHGGSTDHMAAFVALDRAQRTGWMQRVATLQATYKAGITALDRAASTKDFSTATTLEQDHILVAQDTFRSQLFTNTIEGMYSVPEYGGNAGLAGWADIGWPGDSQPRGYTPTEVERSDGLDPVAAGDLPIVEKLLAQLPTAASAVVAQGFPRGRRFAPSPQP